MFPLAGKAFPTDAGALASAIEEALREVFALPKGASPVTAKGGTYPDIKHVKVDLDGAKVSATEPPPKPLGTGKRQPGVTVGEFELTARPIRYEQAKLDLDLTASGLRFDFDRDKAGRPLLVLTDAEDGEVNARVSKKDIEALMLSAATLGAKQQGVTVQDLELELSSTGPRSIAADVRVKAKKMLVTGVVHVTGAVDIDDELNATLSNLRCTGEGMIGTMAAGVMQKHLQAFDGKQVPLMAFSLGDVSLRDLELEVNGALHVSAAFGKQGKKAKAGGAGGGKGKSKRS